MSKLQLDFWRVVDRLTVLELDERLSAPRELEVIRLGAPSAMRAHA